ncbi:hypothetical protein NC652_034763 [Populus alba x Populus x berolinensis]|uniref:Uncharacterized protein n=1 Tax=Populus alba x Populus x berolinensis TaxID=444605 RepID=A0AAD6LN44_9ROSI|nr:hypothetical protein NC652_034763 [Populus alba x Populus x berolinensis]KAJ6970182.1 hypothetical protein NC653_034683 [Populus alba x Populus x berolinensis]
MEGDLDTLTFGPLLLSPFHTVVTVDGRFANEARGFDGTVSWCYCVWRGFNSIGGRSSCYWLNKRFRLGPMTCEWALDQLPSARIGSLRMDD